MKSFTSLYSINNHILSHIQVPHICFACFSSSLFQSASTFFSLTIISKKSLHSQYIGTYQLLKYSHSTSDYTTNSLRITIRIVLDLQNKVGIPQLTNILALTISNRFCIHPPSVLLFPKEVNVIKGAPEDKIDQ